MDREFLFSYEFHGARYNLVVPARSVAEAQMRVARMGNADFDGEVMMTIPVAVRPLQKMLQLLGARRVRSQ